MYRYYSPVIRVNHNHTQITTIVRGVRAHEIKLCFTDKRVYTSFDVYVNSVLGRIVIM